MYYLIQDGPNYYNIFCDQIGDTTGSCSTIEQCLKRKHNIKSKRYTSLEHFLTNDSIRSIIASFESFDTFAADYPELLI